MRSHAAPSSLRELISVATCPLSQESHCGDAALPPIKPQADWAAEPFGLWGGGQLPPRYSWNINLRVQKDRQPPMSLRAEKQRWRYSLKGRRSSPTSSGQPVEARGGEETQTPLQPAAVHGAEENKSIKASEGGGEWSSPPHSSRNGRGQAAKGEAPCALDSIRESARPPEGAGCRGGGGQRWGGSRSE